MSLLKCVKFSLNYFIFKCCCCVNLYFTWCNKSLAHMKSVEHLVSVITNWCFLKYFLSSCPTEQSLRWRQYIYVISQLMGAFISIAAGTFKLAWFLYFLQGKEPFICTVYQLYTIKVKCEHMLHYTWCHEDWWGGGGCRAILNTLWMGDADLRLYITTVQDGWRKSAFLTRAWFPRTVHLITQYMEPFSKWSSSTTRVFGEYFLKISIHKNSEFVINF